MSNYLKVCPEEPVSGVCPVAEIWHETNQFLGLSHEEFLIMLPYLIGALLGFKLFRIALKQFFNW
jgi:hypothetical protein